MDIPAPTGSLEAWLTQPSAPARACAVLCHPHPLYGGSMHDGVLGCLADALLDAGVACLRFNFRGVGASTGHHDGGAGEIDDLLAALRWAATELSPAELWLGGYSFGAFVAWESLAHGATVNRLLLVAPPLGHLPFTDRLPGCPVQVFAGDRDTFINQDQLAAWTGVQTQLIAGADHFFTGYLGDLRRRVELAVD